MKSLFQVIMMKHGIRWRGLHCPTPNLFSSITIYLLCCQLSLIVGSQKMLSTTTDSSIQGLTTIKGSALNNAKYKNYVAEFVSFVVNVEKVRKLEEMLVNSNITKKIEDILQQQLSVLQTIEKYYGFRLQNEEINECAYQYYQYKRYLTRECFVLLTECADTIGDVDILHFTRLEEHEKLIIHACSQRAVTFFAELTHLMDTSYQLSLHCALEASIMILDEMVNATFLNYLENSTDLLLKELDYLLNTYESFVKDNYQEENYTESYSWKEMKLRKIELAEIRHLKDSAVMKAEISNFTEVAQNLTYRYSESKKLKGKEALKKKKNVTLQLTKDLKDFFDSHVRIAEIENDDISELARTPGAYKVVWVNNRLKEIVGRTTMDYPKMTNPFKNAQLNLKTAELFTGVSTTFGKLCVHCTTPENHEICKHVSVNWGGDSDQEVLSKEELLLIDSVEETKHCTCGFRTDCAASNIAKKRLSTCFLIPNSKGQCRGGSGYPCRSHLLEVGKYDESCVSGYCNFERNVCEQMSETGKHPTPTMSVKMERLALIFKDKLDYLMNFFG